MARRQFVASNWSIQTMRVFKISLKVWEVSCFDKTAHQSSWGSDYYLNDPLWQVPYVLYIYSILISWRPAITFKCLFKMKNFLWAQILSSKACSLSEFCKSRDISLEQIDLPPSTWCGQTAPQMCHETGFFG